MTISLSDMTLRILQGLGTTLSVYLVTILLSIPLGMLIAFLKVSIKNKYVLKVIDGYIATMRGTPLLLQILFVYFGLRYMSFSIGGEIIKPFAFLNDFRSVAIAFVLNYAAYFAEIFRGGIQSIEKGQYEASKALGLSYWKMMLHVVLPQAMRAVIPATTNEAITLVKDTALVSAVAMQDLLRISKDIVISQVTIIPFIIVAVIYFLLSLVILKFFQKIESSFEKWA